jgi:hypothetical protein
MSFMNIPQPGMTKDKDVEQKSIGSPFCIEILLNLWLRSEFVWGNLKIGRVMDSEDTILPGTEVKMKIRNFCPTSLSFR